MLLLGEGMIEEEDGGPNGLRTISNALAVRMSIPRKYGRNGKSLYLGL
jgi:hypothetical protein